MKFKKIITICLCIKMIFLFSCQIENSHGSRYIDNQHNIKHLINSTVSILVRKNDDNLSAPRCTAFYVNKRELVTALHCVYTPPSGVLKIAPGIMMVFPGTDMPDPIIGREILFLTKKSHDKFVKFFSPDDEPDIAHAKVVSFDPENDLALLRVKDDEPNSKHWIKMPSRQVLIGERIYGMSMPNNQMWVLTEGIISSKRISPYGKETILHQAHVAPGASGSPIVNENGYVAGVNVAFVSGANYLAVAAPSKVIVNFLNRRPNQAMFYKKFNMKPSCDPKTSSCEN